MADQITKEPETIVEAKVKNPKRVAAGKKLAEYHKKAKKALEVSEPSRKSWEPEISFTTVLSIVGISLGVMNLYVGWRKGIVNEPAPAPAPTPTPTPAPVRKMGME